MQFAALIEDINRIRSSHREQLYSVVQRVEEAPEWCECREASSGEVYYWRPLTGEVRWDLNFKQEGNMHTDEETKENDTMKHEKIAAEVQELKEMAEQKKKNFMVDSSIPLVEDEKQLASIEAGVICRILQQYLDKATHGPVNDEPCSWSLLEAMKNMLNDRSWQENHTNDTMFIENVPPISVEKQGEEELEAERDGREDIQFGNGEVENSDMETSSLGEPTKTRPAEHLEYPLEQSVINDGIGVSNLEPIETIPRNSNVHIDTSGVEPILEMKREASSMSNHIETVKKSRRKKLKNLKAGKGTGALINRWQAIREELKEEEEEEEQALNFDNVSNASEQQVTGSHQMFLSSKAATDSNLAPIVGDWRERVKFKRKDPA